MCTLQKNTRLALYLLVDLTRADDTLLTAAGFAAHHGVPQNHVAKVLQRLRRAGLVDGVRGPRGGHRLRRPPEQIRMLEVVELFEGAAGGDCSLRDPGDACAVRTCNIHGVLTDIEQFATARLHAVTVAELASGPLGPPRSGKRTKHLPIAH